MGVIRLTKDVFKAREERLSQFDESIFKESYLKASKVLVEIVENSEKAKRIIKEEYNGSINESVEYDNNIIAFSGERGSGKTSSMISFHKSLDFKNSLKEDSNFREIYDTLKKYHFNLPSIIDPSVLTNKDSIIETIVGRMFEAVSKEEHFDDVASKRDLIKKFDKVYKNIRIINAEKNSIFEQNQDNLEVLMDMASVVDLKDNLYQLFNCYLNYMNRDVNQKNSFLVIAIDDLDMNMASADKMIEEIRKYLILPNVVILIALRMPQMIQVVKQRNMMQLKETTQFYYKMDKINNSREYLDRHYYDINTKTNKYLDKIFPETHVIDMPYIWSEKTEVRIEEIMKNIPIHKLMKDLFMYSVGYVIGSDIHLRIILPRNLRGFIELIELLDYKKVYENENNKEYLDKKDIVNNVNKLKKYYEEKFVNDIKDYHRQTILRSIFEEDISTLNKKLLIDLAKLIKKKYDNLGALVNLEEQNVNMDYINSIIYETKILSTSVNIGDIINLLKIYELTNLSADERLFYELFKLLYSFRFLNLVCEVLEEQKLEDQILNKIKSGEQELEEQEIREHQSEEQKLEEQNFDKSKLKKQKLRKQEIYQSFVFDIIGRYFDIVDNRYRYYLKWPISIKENNSSRFNESMEESLDNLYYPVTDKDDKIIYKQYKEFNPEELTEEKIKQCKEYNEKFYQLLLPSFNAGMSVTIKERENTKQRTIKEKNKIAKLVYPIKYEKSIKGYQKYIYQPIRVLNKEINEFNNKENISINFLQLICLDSYMEFLDDLDIYLFDIRKNEDIEILKLVIKFTENYFTINLNFNQKLIEFIIYNINKFSDTSSERKRFSFYEGYDVFIKLLYEARNLIQEFDTESKFYDSEEYETKYKELSRKFTSKINSMLKKESITSDKQVNSFIQEIKRRFINYSSKDWKNPAADMGIKTRSSFIPIIMQLNQLIYLVNDDMPRLTDNKR